jgi:hypothetical protein
MFVSFCSHLFCSNRKVLAECRKCETGATVGPVNRTTWNLRYLRRGAGLPCKIRSAHTIKGSDIASSKVQKTDGDDKGSKLNWDPGADCCTSCGHNFNSQVVSCSLNPEHNYCQECFIDVVRVHVTGPRRSTFMDSGIITCPYCVISNDLRAGFDMRVCSQYLNESIYEQYLTCFSEREVIRTQQACEERLKLAASTSSVIAAPIDQDIANIREFQCLSY